ILCPARSLSAGMAGTKKYFKVSRLFTVDLIFEHWAVRTQQNTADVFSYIIMRPKRNKLSYNFGKT
ncbi:MAG TPA: hypothetical protein VFF56_03580, partial [Bacillota bacterium]|nr:hypothetical protein [Bacillota bacterium]